MATNRSRIPIPIVFEDSVSFAQLSMLGTSLSSTILHPMLTSGPLNHGLKIALDTGLVTLTTSLGSDCTTLTAGTQLTTFMSTSTYMHSGWPSLSINVPSSSSDLVPQHTTPHCTSLCHAAALNFSLTFFFTFYTRCMRNIRVNPVQGYNWAKPASKIS